MIRLSLPFPPGVNNLYPTSRTGHRFKSDDYKAWTAAANVKLVEQLGIRPEKVSGPFEVNIILMRRDRRKTDLDGRIKALLDFLTQSGIIEDDSLAQRISIEWHDGEPTKHAMAHIELGAYE